MSKIPFSKIDFSDPEHVMYLFNYGNEIMSKDEATARKAFKKILNYKDICNIHSGCYMNLARMSLNANMVSLFKGESNIKKENEVVSYIESGLKIKPSNKVGHALLVEFYFLKGDFEKALFFMAMIPSKQGYENLQNNLTIHFQFIKHLIIKEEFARECFTNEKAQKFYLKCLDQDTFLMSEQLFATIAELFLNGNEAHAQYALRVTQLAEQKYGETASIINTYANIYSVGLVQYPEELLKYAQKKKVLLSSSKESFPENFEASINTHIGQALIALKRHEEAIEVLEKNMHDMANNTDMHNLACAYYHTDKYDLALQYANRALFTQEDETSLRLVGYIKYDQKKYSEAIQYFERELHFRKNNATTLETIGEDGKLNISYLHESNLDREYEKLYSAFLTSLYHEKQYMKAKIILDEALQDTDNNHAIKSWGSILEAAISSEVIQQTYEAELIEMKQEFYDEREKLKNVMHKYRSWAEELLKIQSKPFDEENLEIEMNQIIEVMKDEALFSFKKVKDMRTELDKRFPFLDTKSREFLVTADFLYQSNCKELIDFAPIVVEYSKVLENELNKRLKLKFKHTLGQLVHHIRSNNVMEFNEYIPQLEQIVQLRNGSAHTSTSTLAVVESIRSVYYEEGLLKNLFMYKN